jgi:hypothetical protein
VSDKSERKAAKSTDTPPSEVPGAKSAHDFEYWKQMINLISHFQHSTKHVLEQWPIYVRRMHLQRFLVHYELFKQVIDLPGCIVDLGVYRGGSFFTWSKLLETFCPTDRRRKVFGFDHFQGLQDFHEKDGAMDPRDGKVVSGYDASSVKREVEDLIEIHNLDNLISGVERCRLIEGDIRETIPEFLKENPGLRISLLHVDMDLYRPTIFALEHLYPLVVKGGVVIFDEYGLIPWQGESIAVEEYFTAIGESPVIRKFPYSVQPHGYFIK